MRYSSLRLLNHQGETASLIPMGEGIAVELAFQLNGPRVDFPQFIVLLATATGVRITRLASDLTHGALPAVTGHGRIRLIVDRLNLLPGVYTLSLVLRNMKEVLDQIPDAASFEIVPAPVYPTGKLPRSTRHLLFYPCEWQVDYVVDDNSAAGAGD